MKLAPINSSSSSKTINKVKPLSSIKEKKMKIVSEKETTSIMSNLCKLWNIIPLFLKFMSFLTILFYTLNIFFKSISFYLSNIPLYTIFHYQAWRIVSSFLVTTNIFNVILGLVFWTREGSSMETRLGTLKYIIIFIMNNVLIQILYTLIISLISLIMQEKDFMQKKLKIKYGYHDTIQIENCGLWPSIMCELTLLCISNPNIKVKFLFIPYEFSAKFYPIIIFAVFCVFNIFNYINIIEVFIGILFSFIYQYILKNKLNVSDKFVEKLEKSICFCWMNKITGFVSVNHINNKFAIEQYNQRMNEKPSHLKKINRKTAKISSANIERNIKINTESSNRCDNSMLSISIPQTSIFEQSLRKNGILP